MQNKTKFKQTEIGEIPEEWKVVKLSDIARIEMGQSPKSEYYNGNCEGLPFLQGIKTFGDRHPYFDTWCTKPAKIAESGDILLSVRAPVGVVNISKDRLCIGRGISAIRGKNTNFIYYLLRANSDKIDSRGTGTVYRSINKSDIQNLVFAMPPELEQQQIASILSFLDDKIELNRKMNKTLEEIGKALFKRWFVDFEFPNDQGKPYKSSDGEMVNSELGKIPIGWEVKTLRQLVEYYVGGGWGSEQQNENHTIEAAVVRGTDIPAIKMGSYSSIPIRFHKKSNYKSRVLEEGDIVFEVSGGSTDQPVGRSSLILDGLLNQYDNKPICASFCKLIRPVKDLGNLLQPSFELLYSTDEIYKYQEKSTGITNFKFEFFLDAYKLTFPLISSLVTQYISFSKSLNSRVSVLAVENENLKKIRDSLLPRLMSGKLRVN